MLGLWGRRLFTLLIDGEDCKNGHSFLPLEWDVEAPPIRRWVCLAGPWV